MQNLVSNFATKKKKNESNDCKKLYYRNLNKIFVFNLYLNIRKYYTKIVSLCLKSY